MHAQQATASANIRRQVASEGIDGDITQTILFYLWVFWAEVETAESVGEVHRWFATMNLVACSRKLFEKVCTGIGLRLSARGRRKRIPTRAR